MSDLITYNKPEDSQRRSKAKELTFEEEIKVVKLISNAVDKANFSTINNELIQRFIDNYQNLNHHMVTTTGLYAINFPPEHASEELIRESFFEIKY